MPAKIPARQTLSGDGGNKLYVPSDGEGNALVTGNLQVDGKIIANQGATVEGLTVNGNIKVNGRIEGNNIDAPFPSTISLIPGVQGSTSTNAVFSGSIQVPGIITSGFLNPSTIQLVPGLGGVGTEQANFSGKLIAPTYIATGVPGFVGDGSGLTNLPPNGGLGPPAFFVQSTFTDFGVLAPNRFVPEIEPPIPAVTLIMSVEMFGKPPGLYFWKTDANIDGQLLWNSASGLVYWDGTKVSGQSTWSLIQDLSILNPEYFLTWSYLSAISLTKFDVQMESSYITIPINPAQPTSYYINVYKLFSA